MKAVVLDNVNVVPSKVVCIGRNYVEHIQELKNEMPTSMVVFMKPNSAITHELVSKPNPLHYEGEISFLIQNGAIAAVGFGLDLTDRVLQNELKEKKLPWERAKAFDGAAVFGKFVSIKPYEIELLGMQLWINDALIQEGNIDLMIYKPQTMLAEINSFSTLEDNDIVMSGTPKGVGSFSRGDRFVGKIFIGEKEISSTEWIVR